MVSIDLNKWSEDLENPDTNKDELQRQIEEAIESDGGANGDNRGNVQYLWRANAIYLDRANDCKEKKDVVGEKSFAFKALTSGRKAIEADPECFEAHCFYVAAMGRVANFITIKERIKYGHEIKKHSDIAFSIPSNSFYVSLLYHIYGRFCYAIASLNWPEKKLAQLVYGVVPESSYEEALEAFKKADTLRQNWMENKLWYIKTLINLKKYVCALQRINAALDMEAKTHVERISRNEILELKNKCSKHVP